MTTAIATHEHITKEQIASEQELVRYNIMRLANQITNNGETILRKYQDFVDGEYPDAKPYLIYKAATNLAIMAGQLPEDTPGSPIRVAPAADDAHAESAPKPKKPTMKELTNWDMGRSIRQQTDNCLDLILALDDMTNPRYVFPSSNSDERKYQKATEIKPHHEFGAMQEIIKRGHGCQNPYSAYPQTSAREELALQDWLSDKIREIGCEGINSVTYLLNVIKNPKENRWGEIITKPYTQTQRLWSIKHLLWRGVDIPWEHITHEDIERYYREMGARELQELQRRRDDPRSAPLTPEQEASVLALLEDAQRHAEKTEAKAAAKAKKAAKKAAKRAAAAKSDAHDYNNANNGKSAANADKDNGKSAASGNNNAANDENAASADKDNGNNTGDTSAPAPTGASETPPVDQDIDPATLTPDARAARALALAIARHPEVDLDVALENHHATAGIPKENLPDDLIYDAVIAEANFQKRQALSQSRMRAADPDAGADDNDPPKTRSP